MVTRTLPHSGPQCSPMSQLLSSPSQNCPCSPLPHTTAGPDLTLFASLLVPGLLGLAFLCGSATLMLAVLGVSPGHAYSLCCINNHSAVILSLGGKFSKGWMWFSLRTEGNCDLEPHSPEKMSEFTLTIDLLCGTESWLWICSPGHRDSGWTRAEGPQESSHVS